MSGPGCPAADLTTHTLYLLDGEVRRRPGPARFTRLRAGLPRLPDAELWLVVRIDRLDLGERTWATILADMERWQAAGNHVQGLQIDFDAATQGLDRYAAFLADARAHVPRPWRLSITGLMDWSANGDPAALARLKPVIDEVVVQTYQGRSTIPGYDAYFRRMAHFPLPFRVAWPRAAPGRRPRTGPRTAVQGLCRVPDAQAVEDLIRPPSHDGRGAPWHGDRCARQRCAAGSCPS
jgi:hypothetical protein